MLISKIGDIAKEKGLKHNFIATKLGERLGRNITPQQFSKWVNDTGKKPDADVLWALAAILDCKVDDLYSYTDNN